MGEVSGSSPEIGTTLGFSFNGRMSALNAEDRGSTPRRSTTYAQ